MIFTSIVRALIASATFATVFKTYEKRYRRSRSKELPKRTFLFRNLLQIRWISNWTSCRTIQGVIAIVFSNRPRASRSSHFEITAAITPWIVLHSVQLLLQIISFESATNHNKEETYSPQVEILHFAWDPMFLSPEIHDNNVKNIPTTDKAKND